MCLCEGLWASAFDGFAVRVAVLGFNLVLYRFSVCVLLRVRVIDSLKINVPQALSFTFSARI